MNSKKYRIGKPRAVAEFVAKLTEPFFVKRGFSNGLIIQDWKLIVGSLLAEGSQPIRITRNISKENPGTLILHVANGAIATEIQHQKNIICERINRYFGFSAVAQIKLIQVFFKKPTIIKVANKFAYDENNIFSPRLNEVISSIEDPEIKDALLSLGRSVSKRCARKGKYV